MTIVLDVETTGLSLHSDEILQLSIISSSGTVLFDEYFKPCRRISWEDVERINHISPAMVEDCSDFSSSIYEINKIISSADKIIGYNVSFDVLMLMRYGVYFPQSVSFEDVMLLFAPIFGQYDLSQRSYRWKKLVDCALYFGYDWSSHQEAHNSLGDCFATLFCYNEIMKGLRLDE